MKGMSGILTMEKKAPDAQKTKAKEIDDITVFAKADRWDDVKKTVLASTFREVWEHGMKEAADELKWGVIDSIAVSKENPEASKCAVELIITKHDWSILLYACEHGLPEVWKHGLDMVFNEGNRGVLEHIEKYGTGEDSKYAKQKLRELKEK